MNKPSPTSAEAAVETENTVSKPSVMQLISRWLKSNLGNKHQDSSLKEVIEEVLEEHEDEVSTLAPEEKIMLRNMLTFGELTVSDIMVPRTEISAVEHTTTLENLSKHVMEQRHTRVPVYEDTLDNIKGFIHVKDLVPMMCNVQPFVLTEVLREMIFVPPSMRIVDLLLKMRLSGGHMAIVVDEYGGTDGLVTLEDLFEEIVGEIQDEHDEMEDYDRIIPFNDRTYEVDARLLIEKLEKVTGLDLGSGDEEEEYDTIGGLIFYLLGRVPARGEIITHEGSQVKLEVLEADPRRVRRVRLHLPVRPQLEPDMSLGK